MEKKLEAKLKNELDSFQNLWDGGYSIGPVLSELGWSGYGSHGYMSVLHATYLKCIKPYINKDTIVLEIGPGKGTWTKALLPANKVVVMDALSAEHNHFWDNIGQQSHVQYMQVNDFSCRDLPDNYFNYMFSLGCLVHVSLEGITEYATNLYPKLKPGCNCFWNIADYDFYNAQLLRDDNVNIFLHLFALKRKTLPLYFLYKLTKKKNRFLDKNEGDEPTPGRWYHAGMERCCEMLTSKGYRIIESNVGTIYREVTIHFTKD